MRMVILDPSLGDSQRGLPRHAQHAFTMARAARAQGASVVVATHRDYVPDAAVPAGVSVEAIFPQSVYWRWDNTEIPYQPSRLTLSPDAVEANLGAFASTCARLFERLGDTPEQLVYIWRSFIPDCRWLFPAVAARRAMSCEWTRLFTCLRAQRRVDAA